MLYTTQFSRFKTIGDGSAGTARTFENNNGCWGIEAGCAASIVIGRREMRDDEEGLGRIRDLRRDGVEVMSYDRLVETYRSQTEWFSSRLLRLKKLVSSRTR